MMKTCETKLYTRLSINKNGANFVVPNFRHTPKQQIPRIYERLFFLVLVSQVSGMKKAQAFFLSSIHHESMKSIHPSTAQSIHKKMTNHIS